MTKIKIDVTDETLLDFEVESSIGFLCRMPESILETEGKHWPAYILNQVTSLTYETQLLSLFEDAWGGCGSWSCDGVKVGSVGNYDVERTITVYTRRLEQNQSSNNQKHPGSHAHLS